MFRGLGSGYESCQVTASPGFPKRLDDARNLLLSHRYDQALTAYSRLAREFPTVATVWFECGNAAAGAHEWGKADAAWNRAMDLASGNSELIALIGHQYQGMRQPEKAKGCFLRAASADPRGINPRISLAVLLEKNHELGPARAVVDECLGFDPRDDQACYLSAVLDRREGHADRAETGLRDLLAREPRHPYVRYAARYELAQILDRSGRFEEAMAALLEAKTIVSALIDTRPLIHGYDRSAQAARRFTEGLPRDILATWAGYFPQPKRQRRLRLAFLGGHPRSGTTLLEQILDAHPEVAALDEPSAFQEVLQPAFHASGELSSARLNTLRTLYVNALMRELGPGAEGKLLVDKNPSPTTRLPVWLRVFPELRVLMALRDPRDVVLSCFFQNLPLNETNVNFLSLERLARHYADLMSIWLAVREWAGVPALETRYEDLVADPGREGRRVTEFLGLSWHESQVRFYERTHRRQIYAPTYRDVTRPVYSSSVARWRQYERHLEPILPSLDRYCRAFGYS